MITPNSDAEKRKRVQRELEDMIKMVSADGMEKSEFMLLVVDAWEVIDSEPHNIIPFPFPGSRAA